MRETRVASLALLLGIFLSSCSQVHAPHPVHAPKQTGAINRTSNPKVLAQIAYAKFHFQNPNESQFGDFGDTDCVNFASQTLLARGWSIDSGWSFTSDASGMHYSHSWISTIFMREYLLKHPGRATLLSWGQRDKVQAGDIAEFDWDASGNPDHMAIVSGIEMRDGKPVILLTSHSPAAFDWPIEDAIAEHGDQTRVNFWHINS
jgi:hypothetical protein